MFIKTTNMKKNLLILSALILSLSMLSGQTLKHDYKNSFAFDPIQPFVYGTFALQYERSVSRHSTLSLALGWKANGGLLKLDGFNSKTLKTNDFEFKGFELTSEYRYYLQQNVPRHTGLYAGAYYRYRGIKDALEGSYYSAITDSSSPLDIEAKFSSNAFGLMLGYKYKLSEHFRVDMLFFGPGVRMVNLNITKNKELPDEFMVDLVANINDYVDYIPDIINNVKDLDIRAIDDKTLETSFRLPAFRYCLKLTYTF